MTHTMRGKLNRAVVIAAAIFTIGIAGAASSIFAYTYHAKPYSESVVKLKDAKVKHGLREAEIEDSFRTCVKNSRKAQDTDSAFSNCLDEKKTATVQSDSELKAAVSFEREKYFTLANRASLMGISLLASTLTGILLFARRRITKLRGLDLFYNKPKPEVQVEVKAGDS